MQFVVQSRCRDCCRYRRTLFYHATNLSRTKLKQKLGAAPIDGVTSVSPEGLTSVTGKHADDLAARCKALGLKCTTIADEDEFRRRMFEKLMWIDTLQLVGDAMGESTVGEAQEKHRELIETVFDEMAGERTSSANLNQQTI